MKPHFILAALLILSSSMSLAELYKYKNEKGRWVFTDRKPSTTTVDVETLASEKSSTQDPTVNTNDRDLAKTLHNTYKPKTAIAEATLAVVIVKTTMGLGSGFFISNTGHIVTNKHVIKPGNSDAWDKYEKTQSTYFKKMKTHLSKKENHVLDMEDSLSRAKRELDSPHLYLSPVTPEKYYDYERRYKVAKKDLAKSKKELKLSIGEYKLKIAQHNLRKVNAKNAKVFQINFKNGISAKANLIAVSDSKDLALLKLNGYTTPYLKLKKSDLPAQGKQVFAIGNPLGQSDTMTAGIITKIGSNGIYTDAQIFPGNSGGPLIDIEGNLIGVNTQKLSKTKDGLSGGLGIAIPVNILITEFGHLISP